MVVQLLLKVTDETVIRAGTTNHLFQNVFPLICAEYFSNAIGIMLKFRYVTS